MKEELKKSNIYTKAINLTISPEQKEALEQISRLYDRTVVGYLRQLINDTMKQHEV